MEPDGEPMAESRSGLAGRLDINALLEFSRLLNDSDDSDRILNALLLSLMGKLGVARAALALPGKSGDLSIRITRGGARTLRGKPVTYRGALPGTFSRIESELFADPAILTEKGLRYALPVSYAGRLYAIILLGDSSLDRRLEKDEIAYVRLVAAISAIALDGARVRNSLRDANRRLERRVRRLYSLLETGRAFSGLLETEEITRLLGLTLMGEMAIGRFALLIDTGGPPHVMSNRFRVDFSPELLHALSDGGTRILEEGDHGFDDGIRAVISVRSQGSLRSTLLVGPRLRYELDQEALDYIEALGSLALSALETRRLLDEMIEKRRLEEDLRIAAEIQRQLLPATLPELPGVDLAALTVPSEQVGGDMYDVIRLPDDSLLVAIADVSGKGTPASLLMSNFQAALRALAPLNLPVAELVGRINDLVHRNTTADKFITAFVARYDSRSGRLTYVNAGHNPPLLLRDGELRPLDRGGVILGVMETTDPYEEVVVECRERDLLVIYTDGVTEAMNSRLQEYGFDRLKDVVRGCEARSAAETLQQIRDDVAAHAGTAPRSDDITLLTLRVQELGGTEKAASN